MIEGGEYRQLAIRIGEPYLMKDRDSQAINHSRVKIMNEESAYMISGEDMAFSCVLMDYDAFVNNPDDTNVFYEYIYCNNWNLVKDIDSPIFLRTKKEGAGYTEERWEDLPDSMMGNLKTLLLSLGEEDGVAVSAYPLLSELMGYYNQKSRDLALKKIGI
jgi:hypothetical protein